MAVDAIDGARITSLRAHGREWLAASRRRIPGEPDASFVAAGTGGWDDVVPTVGECRLPDGRHLTDHGDAWRLPWTVLTSTASQLVTAVDLMTLPVHLVRCVEATAAGLLLRWRATSYEGAQPLLWAAHPLFKAPPGTTMEVEAAHLEVHYAVRVSTPVPRSIDGYGPGQVVKAFAGGCASAVVRRGDGAGVRLRWDPALLPHVGLYWDRDVFTSEPVVAPEPTTGPGDDALSLLERLPVVSPGQPLSWWIAVDADEA